MSALRSLPAVVALLAFAVLAGVLLVAAGQPLITDDAWLHLALGRAYAAQGPWLAGDPLLAGAPGPPTPAAWLFDVALYGLARGAGFTALRALHVALVAAILGVVFACLRRASGSATCAGLFAAVFATLSAYRLIQLRPELLGMLAALALYVWLLDRRALPTRARIVAVALLFAAWANLHASFVLGPLLVGAATAGLLAALPFRPATRAADLARVRAFVTAGALGSLATLINPGGLAPHLAWFAAGRETPSLGRVADEWVGFDPFRWPLPGLPPSGLEFVLQWCLALATIIGLWVAWRAWRSGRTHARDDDASATHAYGPDPALAGLALVSLALPFVAVRFLWLAVFPLLWLAQLVSPRATRTRVSAIAAAASVLVVAAFFPFGPWPMLRGSLPETLRAYRAPYPPGKYHANLVWIAKDAGLRGTGFSDYHVAGFAGFQLAPAVRMLVNGTLNVRPDVIAANLPLRERRGEQPGERFGELLDRHAVDLYFGIRLPQMSPNARPWFHTTTHLERTPGWITLFRNLGGALYLRDDERNRENLEQIAAWYRAQGVPFDPAHGFDPERVIREQRAFARQYGLVPLDFDALAQRAWGSDPDARTPARERLASLYVALGLYERALELDRARLAAEPDAVRARRRLVWSLLHLGRFDEAAQASAALAAQPPSDVLSRRIAATASELAAETDDERRAVALAALPVFDPLDVALVTANVAPPAARLPWP